jgi:transposase
MAKPLVTDAPWGRIRPLLPARPEPKRPDRPGRPPYEDRKALTGILFVLKAGSNWEGLPVEMGCGSGMTCWRRLRDWAAAGVINDN